MDHGKIVWPDAPSMKQYFSIPNSLIYYIAKNPSSHKLYSKLIQSCKYFFEKNPILVAAKFQDCKDGINSLICVNKYLECKKNKKQCCVKIDIKKLKSKMWIVAELDLDYGDKDYVSFILPKLYRCELYHIGICDKIVMFDELEFFNSAKDLVLHGTLIKYNDGTVVMLEKILERFPNVEFFELDCGKNISCVTSSTLANISKHPNIKNIKIVHFVEISEIFSVEDLSAFIKKFKDIKISLWFNENISEAYKEQLDSLIDEIIESAIPSRWIKYDGQDGEKLEILYVRYNFADDEYYEEFSDEDEE